MKKYLISYGGIVLGALYGLALRLIFGNSEYVSSFADLFSFTFIWIVPIIIGIIPLIWAPTEQLNNYNYRLGAPCLTVLLFFCFCFFTCLEDAICLTIISIPFFAGAAFAGFIMGFLIINYRQKKGILYSILLIPFLSAPLEDRISTPEKTYVVRTYVVINATPEKIWRNVIRVPLIAEKEYSKGLFNYAGIPRPLYAELHKDTVGGIRTGHFEGGLIFRETVTQWHKNQKVAFNIEVIPNSIRETIFDQHVLKGDHFKFLNASYELKQITPQQTKLILVSTYRLNTKINGYGAYWGNTLLADFQESLLAVIKNRCDQQLSSSQ